MKLAGRRIRVPVKLQGEQTSFNFTAFDVVVTPAFLNQELEKIPGVKIERYPVEIAGANQAFEILNVIDRVKCIDESSSEILWWTEQDHRQDKVGQYRMVSKLTIDPLAAKGHHLFRLEGWPIALIASAEIKRLFDRHGITGVAYRPVA